MNDDFDELDRALFALPLETPPPGLREAILRATIYAAPVASPLPFSPLETAGIGVALAVAAWLFISVIANHAFLNVIAQSAYVLVRALGDPMTLTWLTTGGAVAVVLTLSNLVPSRGRIRHRRS